MAYKVRGKDGFEIKKDGESILASSSLTKANIQELDDKKKTFLAVASDETEDRDKDIIRVDGWKLTNFKKNPVVPWSHNYYDIPVAKSISIKKVDDGKKKQLVFRPQFDVNDENAMKIFDKYKNGYLTSFSVGFRSLESVWRDEENRWFGGQEFLKQELLEVSCVSVPCNPNASINMGFEDGYKSMLTMGYPEVFAKTDSGLFYPIKDIALYDHPQEFEIATGIKALYAVDSDKRVVPVAYYFDQEVFDDKTANEWVKDNAPVDVKTKYYSFVENGDGSFELDLVEDDLEPMCFEKSIEISKKEIDREDTIESGEDIEGAIENIKNTDDLIMNVSLEVVNDKNEIVKSLVMKKPCDDDVSLEKWFFDGEKQKITEQEVVINEEAMKTAMEELFKEYGLVKKDIANNNDSGTTKLDDVVLDEQKDDDASENDFIDLDFESLKSPGGENKDQEDEIEIDFDLSDIGNDIATKNTIDTQLKDKVGVAFKKALDELSGKID